MYSYVRSGRSTPMTFPYNRGWETQPKSVGVYIPIIRIPIKGGMTIPNIATFDHDTSHFYSFLKKTSSQLQGIFNIRSKKTQGRASKI